MKKYETCEHAEKIGQTCVWVKETCPKALMVRGNMVSTKARCEHCEKYKARQQTAHKEKWRVCRERMAGAAKTVKTNAPKKRSNEFTKGQLKEHPAKPSNS